MPSTKELVIAAQAGEKSAFAQLVRLYERAAIITAHATLRDYHSAQDAAQEAFITAYSKLGQLREPAAFGPWFLQIVRRKASLKRPSWLEAIDSDSKVPIQEESPDWLERYEEVVQHLARLPEHDRAIVVLRYVDGHSVQEIADSIGKPVEAVRKQIYRSIQRLRSWLSKVLS
jgi:RNA polymerase sigma-70 factor (ECF subfamily)